MSNDEYNNRRDSNNNDSDADANSINTIIERERKIRKTKLQLENELSEIERKITHGYMDREIISELQISRSTFYYYKKKIFERSSKYQQEKSIHILPFEQQILKDKLTRYGRIMESAALDRQTRSGDKALCISIAREIAIDIFKLEVEGLKVSNQINNDYQKAIEYAPETAQNLIRQSEQQREQEKGGSE